MAVALTAAALSTSAAQRTFMVTTPAGNSVTLSFYNDNVVKVTNLLPGQKAADKGSAAIVPGAFSGTVTEDTPSVLTVSTPDMRATVDKTTGAVTLLAGTTGIIDNGVRRLPADGKTTLTLTPVGNGSYYGAGERGYSLNLAGDSLVMYNKQNYGYVAGEERLKQMNISMPLFLSSNGYAVVFDDYAPATLYLGNPIEYTTESPEPVSYFFVNGHGTLAGTTHRLSELTGRQKLPPFWSLGYITSKYGYRTQAETTGVIDTLKREGYPVDGVVLDLYWYGKEQDMGRLAWDPEQWPDHRKMLSDLKRRGVKTVIISQPYILRNGRALDNYNMLADSGMMVIGRDGKPQEVKIWVGEGGMFDVSNPATRRWLGNRYRRLTDEGVTGWWGDLGEPEVHPEEGRHSNGLMARQYHNKYGNDWSSIISELFEEQYPDTRLMTMMRGGTTGLQRYSVFPWSTDVSRSWGGLRPQVTIMLNSSMSGLGYMSHDVGGFAVDPEHPVDPELYVRWLQLGAYSPILRTHAQHQAEPYKYPEYRDIILPLIKARYANLPYTYTLAWENAAYGLPLVRPLNFYAHTPGRAVSDVDDEYLWGRDLLIAPVLTRGATSRKVVFPAEGRWLDLADPSKIYEAGQEIDYPAPLSVLPVFVRAGSFIPSAPYKMDNTGDYTTAVYNIDYYPVEGVSSSYVMFEDDRQSAKSLENGQYRLVTFKGNDTDGCITINVAAEGDYKDAPKSKKLTFVIHNVADPASVRVEDGKAGKKHYDAATRTLTLPVSWKVAKPLTITLSK